MAKEKKKKVIVIWEKLLNSYVFRRTIVSMVAGIIDVQYFLSSPINFLFLWCISKVEDKEKKLYGLCYSVRQWPPLYIYIWFFLYIYRAYSCNIILPLLNYWIGGVQRIDAWSIWAIVVDKDPPLWASLAVRSRSIAVVYGRTIE